MQSTKKKRCTSTENVSSSNSYSLRKYTPHAVKMESVKKTSQTKDDINSHLDALLKNSSVSDRKQKLGKPSPLAEKFITGVKQRNTVPKQKKASTSLNCHLSCPSSKQEDCKSISRTISLSKSSEDKENVLPSVKLLQTRSSTKKLISKQQPLPAKDKQNVPCYEKDVLCGSDSVLKLETHVGRNPSRRLMFQENFASVSKEGVYDFDEDDVSSKSQRKNNKRKKQLDLSDEEYLPSKTKRMCKPHVSLSSKNLEGSNCSNCPRRRKKNTGRKTKPENSLLTEKHATNNYSISVDLQETLVNRTVSSDLKVNHINDEKLHLKPVVVLKRLSLSIHKNNYTSSVGATKHITLSDIGNIENIVTCKTTGYISPKSYVERNCSIDNSFLSHPRTLLDDEMACLNNAEDSPDNFKGFTPCRKLCISHTSQRNLKVFSTGNKESIQSKDLTVFQNNIGHNVAEAVIVKNLNLLPETNISRDCCKHATDLPMASMSEQPGSSKVKEIYIVQHSVSVTCLKEVCNGNSKLDLKPVVDLRSLAHKTCSSDHKSPDKGTACKSNSVFDTSNKENIPTNEHKSTSKTRHSRKLWRPTAYVSPKAYTERNSSFEDSFYSPLRISMENNIADHKKKEDASSHVFTQDEELCENLKDVSSRSHSKCFLESDRLAFQKTDNGLSISDINSESANAIGRILVPKEDVCISVTNGGVNTICADISDKNSLLCEKRGRLPAVHSSNVSGGNISNNAAVIVDHSEHTNSENSFSKTHSISVNSVNDVSFTNKNGRRIEIRASRGMCPNFADTDLLGKCNSDNYFGFDHEEPEEELLSPIKVPTCAQPSQLSIATSSTPDHGTSTAKSSFKPWRPPVNRVASRPRKQVQATMHSFLSKSAPQFLSKTALAAKHDAHAVIEPETATSTSLHHTTTAAQEVTTAESTPTIYDVYLELPDSSDSRQPSRRVYTHPRKCNLDSLQEEQMTDNKWESMRRKITKKREENNLDVEGENLSRKATKKRSKKEVKADGEMRKFLSEINNEFKEIENFELCVE
ncbi:uncharacterized protein LOC134535702 [Bacillus rossius redtenbacheri]|uniref:uncharacterized protein LOC134535702 n=1 Tax=Bacillus rossius redtenbacheri TaxID=93214 RepID=UPI002FDE153E